MSQTKPTKAEIDAYASSYVLHGNQSEAFRAAFPKSKGTNESVNVKASNFHKLVKVKLRVQELAEKAREIAEKEFKLNAEYVSRRLKEIDELDIIDIMNDNMSEFKPLSKWPKAWRTSISGFDLMTIANSSNELIDSIVRKVKWPDKTKNLELIGKLTKVGAFTDQHKHSGELTVKNLISEISTRNAEGRKVLPSQDKD